MQAPLRILKTDGNGDEFSPTAKNAAFKPVTYTRMNQLDKDGESPLMFQGYSTMQLAGTLSGNVSQSLLHNTSNQK